MPLNMYFSFNQLSITERSVTCYTRARWSNENDSALIKNIHVSAVLGSKMLQMYTTYLNAFTHNPKLYICQYVCDHFHKTMINVFV